MSDKKQQVIDLIKEMTVLELSELVKEMEEIFGVSA
ncbi:MAG: 50S ribosomal protein L7/L12, partial [Candidatus Cloacimonetes bacterium]|nr:50S ribosomal protein L7/L12 [Candidatus Cloacimonadota bacterium]